MSLTLEKGWRAIGVSRLTAFIKMNTTDSTPHALPRPKPDWTPPDPDDGAVTPPALLVPTAGGTAAAPPDTKSALFAGTPSLYMGANGFCCFRLAKAMAAGLERIPYRPALRAPAIVRVCVCVCVC